MKASYGFNSHEEAQVFVNEIGKLAEKLEHHPEWSTSDEGKLVHIRLTTHDLGNRLGLKDFQLAKHIVETSGKMSVLHNPYPVMDQKTMSSIQVFGLTLLGSLLLVKLYTHDSRIHENPLELPHINVTQTPRKIIYTKYPNHAKVEKSYVTDAADLKVLQQLDHYQGGDFSKRSY